MPPCPERAPWRSRTSASPSPDRRSGRRSNRPTVALLLAGALLTTSACAAGPSGTGGDALRVGQDGTGAHGPTHAHTAPTLSRALPATQTAAPTSAVALRSDLQRLLGEHVLLADELVRTTQRRQTAQAEAATAAVGRNQSDLVALVRSAGGAQPAASFEKAWKSHVDVLGAYATAVQEKDTAGQRRGRAAYTGAERQLARVFSTVVGGTVSEAALLEAATAHGEHLLDQVDAYAAGDYDRAYALQREAFGHMIAVADVLARGAATAKGLPTAELDAPRRELQTALSRLLAEHMGLMVQTMRASHDRAPDFAAAGKALNANSADLGGAIGTLYGAAASKQFLALWAQHIEALIVYARTEDEAEQRKARQAQIDYAPRLARFLSGATSQRLPAIELAAALTVHDDHLLDQADAYAADDATRAQSLEAEGYAHMFELSQTLAVAIGDTVAAKLPKGGAATGGGGLAGTG